MPLRHPHDGVRGGALCQSGSPHGQHDPGSLREDAAVGRRLRGRAGLSHSAGEPGLRRARPRGEGGPVRLAAPGSQRPLPHPVGRPARGGGASFGRVDVGGHRARFGLPHPARRVPEVSEGIGGRLRRGGGRWEGHRALLAEERPPHLLAGGGTRARPDLQGSLGAPGAAARDEHPHRVSQAPRRDQREGALGQRRRVHHRRQAKQPLEDADLQRAGHGDRQRAVLAPRRRQAHGRRAAGTGPVDAAVSARAGRPRVELRNRRARPRRAARPAEIRPRREADGHRLHLLPPRHYRGGRRVRHVDLRRRSQQLEPQHSSGQHETRLADEPLPERLPGVAALLP